MVRLMLMVLSSLFVPLIALGQESTGTPAASDEAQSTCVSVLLITDEGAGANYDIRDASPSIQSQLDAFGWDITIAAPAETSARCGFATGAGLAAIKSDTVLADLTDLTNYDIVCLLPNQTGMASLTRDTTVLTLLNGAAESGVIVAAWCKSVRVLAAAGLLKGLEVVGHADYRDEYTAAGATYLGNDHPPVTQGNIVTAVRSRYYRTAMCQAMKKAVTRARRDRPDQR